MSHESLSFEEAERQVVNLMAAVGASANAYEDEVRRTGIESTFEAALASLESLEQHSDRSGRIPPPSLEESSQGISTIPADGEPEESSEATEDDYGWCATGLDELGDALMPELLEPDVYSFHNVVECAGTLEPIWLAFKKAQRTGQPQELSLPGRTLELCDRNGDWEVRDEIQGIWYLMAGENDVEVREVLEPGDLFVWVIPLTDDSLETPIGYIHNGYVFQRKS